MIVKLLECVRYELMASFKLLEKKSQFTYNTLLISTRIIPIHLYKNLIFTTKRELGIGTVNS